SAQEVLGQVRRRPLRPGKVAGRMPAFAQEPQVPAVAATCPIAAGSHTSVGSPFALAGTPPPGPATPPPYPSGSAHRSTRVFSEDVLSASHPLPRLAPTSGVGP